MTDSVLVLYPSFRDLHNRPSANIRSTTLLCRLPVARHSCVVSRSTTLLRRLPVKRDSLLVSLLVSASSRKCNKASLPTRLACIKSSKNEAHTCSRDVITRNQLLLTYMLYLEHCYLSFVGKAMQCKHDNQFHQRLFGYCRQRMLRKPNQNDRLKDARSTDLE